MNVEKLFNGVFKDKIVLVTGHTGFQGSWLSLWLKLLGANVIGYSLDPPTNPSLFDILELKKEINHNIGDVRNLPTLQKTIQDNDPEFVFHLAAQPIVRMSYDIPIETFEVNVMGTINVLEALRNSDVRVCEIITSDKCYENRNLDRPYTENDHIGGKDPYSASKGAAEIVTSSYRNSFFNIKSKDTHTSIASVRAGNVIGGGDWASDRIIPDCVRQLLVKKPIKIRNPHSIRPWQFVLESVSGMLLLASKMYECPTLYSEAWNFGPDESVHNITVQELVDLVIAEWGSGKSTTPVNTKKEPHEEKLLRLDSNKAKKMLMWNPIYSIQECIAQTIMWYKYYSEQKTGLKDLTIKQIEYYSRKANQMKIPWAISE
jgi:CDP-glucose 4,6-dehydratase